MPETPVKNYRFPVETLTQIEQIAAEKHGLTATQILKNAVAMYHRSMFGRRSADLTPPTLRRADRRQPKG